MAVFLGMFLAKLLSVAGIGGLVAGLFIKKLPAAVGVGVALGIADTLILSLVRHTGVAPISWIMAIFVAVLTSTLAWWVRGRKRE